eukprot:203478_1
MQRLYRILRQLKAFNKQTRKYAVFVCGPHLPNPIGDYGIMITKMLKQPNDNTEFITFFVHKGQLPSFSDLVNHYNGIIISGSKYDAHANNEWTVNLRKLIKQLYDYNVENTHKIIKMIGFCFGHQVIMHALRDYGGLCGRNNKTVWEIGIKTIKLENAFYNIFKNRNIKSLKLIQAHRDAVLSLPNNAIVLASSNNTDVEMYSVGKQIFCVQGHPEFDIWYLNAIIETKLRLDESVPHAEIEYACKSMKELKPDNHILKDLVLEFLAM